MASRNCVSRTSLCLQRLSSDVAWGFRLAGGLQEASKLFVTRVTPGSPAALAGLQKGDTIEFIDGCRGADLTYSDAMQMLKRNSGTMALEIIPSGFSSELSSNDLHSMLSASPRHSRNTYNLFNQQPQPQQQQVPDKLLNLYYQGGPQDKKPFSYTADNQLLERELQDAFMRRRRSRPRYRSTSSEVGNQQTVPQQQQHQQQQQPYYPVNSNQRNVAPPYYERSTSLVTPERTSFHQEATR
uniref:PDZ domain-containing protein n=1 Tax=Macrostomum lignano TaxID=282301 RepID=A0A1I8JGF1_9PLAT